MKKIIISPFSKGLRPPLENQPNPKNFPYWKEVVAELRKRGHYVIQVGAGNEKSIDANEMKMNLRLKDLANLLLESDTWIAVDNFFQHFASHYKKRGVVIFSKSDPNIFGYKENINLLKNRRYLRPDQFQIWEQCEYTAEAFVSPIEVVNSVEELLKTS
jgi:ADP-heptose:LPS heptosyltransferase